MTIERTLRSVAIAIAVASCAHPSPAPAPPPLAAPPPPPCTPSRLKELAATIPTCASIPAGLLDAARINEAPLGSRVSVRGFLVPGAMECDLVGYSTVNPVTGEMRPVPCGGGCGGFWLLAGFDEATATSRASGTTQILLKPTGSVLPLEMGGNGCVIDALEASPHEEIIASGRLGPAPMSRPALGTVARDARVIDYAILCATGRWTPPRATADGGLPGCQ